MTEDTIRETNLDTLLAPVNGTGEIDDIKLRPITAGTLALCELGKIKLMNMAEGDDPNFFEVMSFLFIHSMKPKEVRKIMFDKSDGKDEEGRCVVFVDAVIDWAEKSFPISGYTNGLERMAKMMEEAFAGTVEAVAEGVDDVAKKKE